jgi:hypothetical protein
VVVVHFRPHWAIQFRAEIRREYFQIIRPDQDFKKLQSHRGSRDAYSHEVSSCGFWPGTAGIEPFFYRYAYPEAPGYRQYSIAPEGAHFEVNFGEFIFPYELMRCLPDPDAALLEFLQTTYEAAANCADWDRQALEI